MATDTTHSTDTAPARAMMHRFVDEVINGGRLDLVGELYAPDVVAYVPGSPEPVHGADAYTGVLAALRAGFPDIHAEIVELAVDREADGDGQLVMACMHTHGTNTGDLFGLPATGRPASWVTVHIWHVRDGRVASDRVTVDFLALFAQLGLVEPPAPAAS